MTQIFIAAGTVVGELSNSPKGIQMHPVKLAGDVYIDATRQEDGSWGYTLGEGRKTRAYCCAGGSAEVCR